MIQILCLRPAVVNSHDTKQSIVRAVARVVHGFQRAFDVVAPRRWPVVDHVHSYLAFKIRRKRLSRTRHFVKNVVERMIDRVHDDGLLVWHVARNDHRNPWELRAPMICQRIAPVPQPTAGVEQHPDDSQHLHDVRAHQKRKINGVRCVHDTLRTVQPPRDGDHFEGLQLDWLALLQQRARGALAVCTVPHLPLQRASVLLQIQPAGHIIPVQFGGLCTIIHHHSCGILTAGIRVKRGNQHR
mmetsp:Transcript_12853/g.30824  ORF Transcript_12853/g.30824 Transcript_12853/m.30824 type:complete len:242 (-) Transcript_12853:1488-2213(-)